MMWKFEHNFLGYQIYYCLRKARQYCMWQQNVYIVYGITQTVSEKTNKHTHTTILYIV